MSTNLKIAIGAILFFIAWNVGARYFWMSYQHDKDLAIVPDTSAPRLGEKTRLRLPPDTSIAKAVLRDSRGVIAPKTPHSSGKIGMILGVVESLKTANQDLTEEVANLSISREVTVTTKQGEEINVTYDPPTENFTVITHPFEIIQPIERDITRSIPKVESPTSDFWTQVNLLYSGGAGVMATLGFKTLGVGYGIISEKPAYAVILHFTL